MILKGFGLRNVKSKDVYFAASVHVNVAADLLSFPVNLLSATIVTQRAATALADLQTFNVGLISPTVPQVVNVTATADLLTYNVATLTATAIQVKDITTAATTEVYSVALLDPTITTEIIALPNLVPVADVSVSDWQVAPLWSKINTPANTTTFVSSSNSTNSTCRIRFNVPNYNAAASLHFFRKKTTGNDPTFAWILYRNGVNIQSNSLVLSNVTFEESVYALTANIVSGATYELEMTRSGGGNPTQRGILDIASVYIDPV